MIYPNLVRITIFLFFTAGLFAQKVQTVPAKTDNPLTLDEVLGASVKRYPEILKSLAALRSSRGKRRAARGAFDTKLELNGYDRVNGFWTGRTAGAKISQPLRPMGASVFGGYRISDGVFPTYEDKEFTNTGGEFRVGVLLPLLRNRSIDAARFGMTDSELAFQMSRIEVLLTKVRIQRQARIAYWRWVAAGRQLGVYQNLYSIALQRQTAFEEQVRRGARARIFLIENQQNLNRRRRLVRAAERDLQSTANDLSLFYRAANGDPS